MFKMPLLLLPLLAGALSSQEAQSPERTRDLLQVPPGFSVRLFAGEPDLSQPIGFCIDDRGRLWVIEGASYPAWRDSFPERDRVWIFEDRDGDGRFDERKLFTEGLTYATGIEVGFGGVWIIAPPKLLFFPDRDGDDRPDGPPEVLLDGFGVQGGHNVVNGFTWGPDGWLYGGHGRTSPSDLGPPGTPPEERQHFDGGVYRYHPVRRVFEAFADGSTNPWGVAFDRHGQAFVSNCVNAHLFHVVQGSHFEPWRDRPSSRYAYRRIAPIADHLHYSTGRKDSHDGGAAHDALGGGHAHSGAMVYLGGAWPEAYRGAIFMSNLHGRRLNTDLPRRKGSGFVASHGPDFVVSKDPMFTGLLIQYGPDGSVFVSDWYDRGECHTRDPHRASGRIYKIVYGSPEPVKADLGAATDEQLVSLQLHENEWYVTHARRLLQERALSGPRPAVQAALREILERNPDPVRKLRALWALHVTGGLSEQDRLALLERPEEHVRAWTVQLELEDRKASPAFLERMARMARSDASPVVRMYLASGIRRLPPAERAEVLRGLVGRAEDAEDPNLPLLVWYASEELAEADRDVALDLMKRSRLPSFREFMARRLTALSTDLPVLNVATLGALGDGQSDDAPAFRKAFEKLEKTGGRVLVPWGVRPYRIASPLRIAVDRVELWGPGARLRFDLPGGEEAGLRVEGAGLEEFSIRGLRFEGAAMDLRGVRRVDLEDVQLKGGLTIDGVRALKVSRSRFDGLTLRLSEPGSGPRAEVEFSGVSVDRRFSLSGDRSGLRLENCRLAAE
jgi:putative membrane-bound dehydrogenase-like protein